MFKRNRATSFLYGGNAPYIEELHETYLADPDAVSGDWRGYFDALQTIPAVDGTADSDSRTARSWSISWSWRSTGKRAPSRRPI